MTRRHQIVHRGDLIDSGIDAPCEAAPIAADVVTGWYEAVKEFISVVIAQKVVQDFVPRLKKRDVRPTKEDEAASSDCVYLWLNAQD
jgi:hypothetical protein